MASVKQQRLTKLLSEVRAVIAVDQPHLRAKLEAEGVLVSGTYLLQPDIAEFKNQGSIAKYEIKIYFPEKFPTEAPIVEEIGGEIKRNADYHIFDNGTCCIVIWETWALFNAKVSVQTYFDTPLRNFFLSQYCKKLEDKWVFGEELHGKAGLIYAFARQLSCNRDEKQIRRILQLLSKGWKSRWKCFCSNQSPILRCYKCKIHLNNLRKNLSKVDAEKMLLILNKYEARKNFRRK